MALSLIARNCTKFGSVPRISSQFLRTQFVSPIRVPAVSKSLTKELQHVRNISVTSPKLSASQGSHTGLWTAERILSLALLGILPAAIAIPCQALDYALAVSMIMHAHWGLEAVVTDYVRPIMFGNMITKVAHIALIVFSATTLAGLCYFIYNDVGIAKAVRKFWAIKGQ